MNHQLLITFGVLLTVLAWFPQTLRAQFNSGSDGSDGALNVTVSTNINMADHPDGIYHYTSVYVAFNKTVTFTPNSNNTPVIWLVQGNCTIDIGATVDVSGKHGNAGGNGGPGGYPGGAGGLVATAGQGPGGGLAGGDYGGGGSYGTVGTNYYVIGTNLAGPIYGNIYVLPLIGGSGGGGETNSYPGGGGGGAILIAANGQITLNGYIKAGGGGASRSFYGTAGGCGSGGAVRLVAQTIAGTGSIDTSGGANVVSAGGLGRVRLDSPSLTFSGTTVGAGSSGFQPIIIPSPGQGVRLNVVSVSGAPVPPDAIISSQVTNPVPVVVQCMNIRLNTPVTVTVKPVNGPAVSAVGYNTVGTDASSTATVLINIPRGPGLIYATAATAP